MLREAQQVIGCAIGATNGEVGKVEDFYFDDQAWTMRYLVVETGAWLNRRKVLISRRDLGDPQWDRKLLTASITIEEVKSSPPINTTKPVSRQHELLFLSHYQNPRYWECAGPPTVAPTPTGQLLDAKFGWSDAQFSNAVAVLNHRGANTNEHLRSCNAVLQYSIRSQNGDLGTVHGLLLEEEDWTIRYLIVRTGHWWRYHPILVGVESITSVNWLDSSFSVMGFSIGSRVCVHSGTSLPFTNVSAGGLRVVSRPR